MAEKSKIQWTDSTANFWEGCTKYSPGCANCYAEERDQRFHGGGHWGPSGIRRKSRSAVKDALVFNRKPWICDACGHAHAADEGACHKCSRYGKHRRRIFALSLGDWLEGPPGHVAKDGTPFGGVPVEWRAEFLDTVRICEAVEFILCTKRIGDWRERMQEVYTWARGDLSKFRNYDLCNWVYDWLRGSPPKNVTLLTSVENQEQADARIPALLRIPAARRGLSLEPLLGPVDLSRYLRRREVPICTGPRNNVVTGFTAPELDWLIVGGESGPKARPCNVDWIRSLVQQGKAASVPVFVKQLGSDSYDSSLEDLIPQCGDETSPEDVADYAINFTRLNLRDRKGGDPAEWPEDLRVQEFPFD